MVGGLNDASWYKEVPCDCVNDGQTFLGVFDPKNRGSIYFSREITAKTLMINNFQTVRFNKLVIMNFCEEFYYFILEEL